LPRTPIICSMVAHLTVRMPGTWKPMPASHLSPRSLAPAGRPPTRPAVLQRNRQQRRSGAGQSHVCPRRHLGSPPDKLTPSPKAPVHVIVTVAALWRAVHPLLRCPCSAREARMGWPGCMHGGRAPGPCACSQQVKHGLIVDLQVRGTQGVPASTGVRGLRGISFFRNPF
jgi:hypothetical protein